MTDEETRRLEEADEQKFIEHIKGCQKEWKEIHRSPQLASISFDRLISIIDTKTAELKYAKQEVKVLNDELFRLKKEIEEIKKDAFHAITATKSLVEKQAAQLKEAVEALELIAEEVARVEGSRTTQVFSTKEAQMAIEALSKIRGGK